MRQSATSPLSARVQVYFLVFFSSSVSSSFRQKLRRCMVESSSAAVAPPSGGGNQLHMVFVRLCLRVQACVCVCACVADVAAACCLTRFWRQKRCHARRPAQAASMHDAILVKSSAEKGWSAFLDEKRLLRITLSALRHSMCYIGSLVILFTKSI